MNHKNHRVNVFFRILSLFICLAAFLGMYGLLIFGKEEGFKFVFFMLIPLVLMLYVFLPIALKGQPPKLLQWWINFQKRH